MLKIYPAVKVRDTFSVSKALGIIKKEKTPVVVVDSRNRYIGMLDARRIKEHPVPDPSNTKCSTLAVKAPRLTELTDPLKVANAFFISRFSMLPVVDDYDRVVGLVSRYDLLKLLLEKGMIPKKKVGEVASVPAITIEEYEFGLGKWFNNRFFVLLFRKLGDRKISKAFIIEVKDTETTILPCNADPKILEQVKNEVIPGLVSLMITVLSFPLIELLFAWNVHRHQKLLKL